MINIYQGKADIKVRSAKHIGIGTINGNTNISISNAAVSVDCEGDESSGIGDAYGNGNIKLTGADIKIKISASLPMDIGSKNGELVLYNSKVDSVVNEKNITHK